MRLVLGHLSSFGGQWFCPGDGIGCGVRVTQGKDKCSPFKVGDKGGFKSRRYAVGSFVCYITRQSRAPSAPFHFQPASTCTSKLQGRLLRTRLVWLIVCCLLYRSSALRGCHLISFRSKGPVIAMHQEMIPRGWVEF